MLKSGFNACSGLNCLAKPFGFGQYAKHTVFVNDLYMIKAILYACVLLAGAHCAAAENAEALGVKNVSFKENWDSRRVLKNPGKGWYHHILDNGVDNYKIFDEAVFESFPGMDHLYIRIAWSYLEPEEGKFAWSLIDGLVEKYVPRGYKLAFRITGKETGILSGPGQHVDGVNYATPYWVREAGAKGTVVEAYNWLAASWAPEYGDPVYLEKLDNFHRAFAERYDGKEWVAYVDVGSIGDWGEGHTGFSKQAPPSVETIKANIDVYLKNYKHTQIVASDDMIYFGKPEADVRELYEYAVDRGLTLRDDSILVASYVKDYIKTWTVSHPQFYDPLYLKKPIVLEMEHYGSVREPGNWIGKNGEGAIPEVGRSGADIMRKALETMHATYIGYHGPAEEWLAENPDFAAELANRCGYWYFPVSARFPAQMKRGANGVGIEWLNRGVAPAYQKYAVIFRFESSDGKNSFDVKIDDSGNARWLPDAPVMEKYAVNIPETTKSGDYVLKFKLADFSAGKGRDVQIALKSECVDADGFAELGRVRLD